MNQQVQQDQQILPEYLIKEKKKLNTSYSSENDLSFSSHIQNALREDTKCSVQLNETTIHDYQKHIQHLNNILSKSANKNDSLRKQIKELNLQINLLQEQSLSQQTTQLMGQAMRIIQVENAALKEELNLYKIKPIETQLIEQIQNYNTPEIERIHLILEQQLRHKGVQTELLKRELILIKQIKQIDQLQKAKAELEQSFYLTSCKLEHKRTKARNNKIENKLLKNYVDHFHLKTSTEIMNIFDSNNNLEVFESNLNHSRIEPQMSLKLQQNKDEVLSQRDSLEDPTQPLKKKLLEQDQILQQFYHKQEQLQNQIESQLELIQNQKQQIEQYDHKHLELEAQIIQLQTTLSEQNESCNQLICDLKAKLEKKQMVQSLNTHQKKQIQNNHMVNSNFESPQKSGLFKKQTSFDYQFTKKSSTSNFGKTERDLSESIDLKYFIILTLDIFFLLLNYPTIKYSPKQVKYAQNLTLYLNPCQSPHKNKVIISKARKHQFLLILIISEIMSLIMNFMKPSSTVVRSADSYRDFTLQMLEIKPFAIQEQKCPQICKCPICQRRSTPQVRKNSEIPQRSGRMMRRFSIEGFKDEFLFICQMLQKTDTAIRPLNIRIHDTLFLKDRDLHMLVYYDNGLQFMRQKLYLSTETEKFFVDRRNQFELKRQIEQIEQGCHDRYTYKQYMEMNNIVTQKLKTEIYHQSQMKNLLIARYQSGDSLIMTQYEFHQMMYLTKTNSIFDSLIHLQLYLYNEQEGIMQPNLEDRNSKDFYIHKYVYKQDPQMFQDVLSEFSTLTNPSIRGEKQWKKEKAYMDNLELDQYFKYSGHKIAAYVECFHQVNIISMEIHFIINGTKSISIINIVKIQHCNAETLQWKIHQVHKVNTADKIRSNEFEILKQEYKPLTERGRALSNQMLQYTQRVVDKIRPITQKMTEDAERECQSNEAFIILNPKQSISCSIHKILGDKQYDKLLGNFPKQMIRLQKNTDKIVWKKKKDEPDNNKELVLEDYLVKTTMRKKPRIEIQSRFQRSISKKFFRSSY